ncbi:MAG: NAD(P)-dependent oxidoreductase [Verrucomicrobiota bacterium]
MSETILVTQPEYVKAEAVFKAAADVRCEAAPPEEGALAELVSTRRIRAVIVGVAPYRGPLYGALAKQGPAIISRFGVGHDSIDKALSHKNGIAVTNTPGVLDESVAEHTFWLMGSLVRRVAQLDADMRQGNFRSTAGMELRGKTLGILGLGGIGRKVAAMAHFGFGMKVIVAGRQPVASHQSTSGIDFYTDKAEHIFRQCDILSVHLRSDATTRHFINAERLSWLKPGALLINTARGAVMDESALFDALNTGRLAGAALDVFEHEPYQPVAAGKDLRKLDNVVLTPHVGSNTREANRRMGEASLNNVRHFLAGRLDQLSHIGKPLI